MKTREKLVNLVTSLIKEASKVTLRASSSIPEDSHLISQFGGQPYFEKGETWPKAKDDSGNYCDLEFVFQIYNDGKNSLPEHIKLVQFYYDFESWPWNTDEDGWLVKIYENINLENYQYIEKPKHHDNVNYCELSFEQIKTLPHWDSLDDYCEHARSLSYVLDKDWPWYAYQEVAKELVGEQGFQTQIGGYPHWIQNSGNPSTEKFSFLFQVDSEDEAGLRWGDCGLLYIFYNAETKQCTFNLQCT